MGSVLLDDPHEQQVVELKFVGIESIDKFQYDRLISHLFARFACRPARLT